MVLAILSGAVPVPSVLVIFPENDDSPDTLRALPLALYALTPVPDPDALPCSATPDAVCP